jgi:hypothetical protein
MLARWVKAIMLIRFAKARLSTHSITKLELIASWQMRVKNMTGKTNGMNFPSPISAILNSKMHEYNAIYFSCNPNNQAWLLDTFSMPDKICTGSIEYTLDNKTRVDCQLSNESQEYDWQNKWYECLDQAAYYAMEIPAVTLKLSSDTTTPIIVNINFFILFSFCSSNS